MSIRSFNMSCNAKEWQAHTPGRIRICLMQLESDTFNEITQIICTSYDVRIWCRGRASYSNCPPMGMVRTSERLALFKGQNSCSVSIDDWTIYTKSLERLEHMFCCPGKEADDILEHGRAALP